MKVLKKVSDTFSTRRITSFYFPMFSSVDRESDKRESTVHLLPEPESIQSQEISQHISSS